MIKTIKYSYNKKSPPYKRFLEGILGVVIVLSVFLGVHTKQAFAYNNYIDDVRFYKADSGSYAGYDLNGYAVVSFHVKTTFTVYTYSDYYSTCYNTTPFYTSNFNNGGLLYLGNACYDNGYTFEAGKVYIIPLTRFYTYIENLHLYGYLYDFLNGSYNWVDGTSLNASDYISNLFGFDIGQVYFEEEPNLFITFPHDNDEIAGAFTIQGSYTVPANGYYDVLEALFSYQSQAGTIGSVRFYQNLSTSSGEVNIPIDGLPANYYALGFLFLNFHDCFEVGDCGGSYMVPFNIHLNIVKDIPPALPSGETPPVAPIYNPLDPTQWYNAHSSDTPSDLYITLTNTFSPLITNLGSNLVAFAGQFTGSQAQEISDNVSNAIITIKSYANNLNSFFNGLPVVQLLTGYILVFLAITIFRLAKGIINLFKI